MHGALSVPTFCVRAPAQAFAAQLGAVVAVLLSSALKLPVSTSHCLVAAVAGCGAVHRYMGDANKNGDAIDGDLDFWQLGKIAGGAVLTMPLAVGLTILSLRALAAV